MKRFSAYFAVGALLVLLNSCVYSLFPIYTEDTLVFIPELVGRWQLPEEDGDYIEFTRMSEEEDLVVSSADSSTDQSQEEYTDSVTVGDMTIRYNAADGMKVNGKMTYNRDSIRMFYEEIAKKSIAKTDSPSSDVGIALDAMGKTFEALGNTVEAVSKVSKRSASIKGTAYSNFEESYRVSVMDNGKLIEYIGHIAKIGKDYFLDIFPLAEYSDDGFGSNVLPVHTFLKLRLTGQKLVLTPFDLEKLNRLFESNLIRLRHENVDGTVLITAQPKEIQKFLERYSEDETVFEDADIYERIDS
ncbi:hypothetical protein OU792_09415 [Algoriphagus sp. NF]|uniref:hypothetical protein n=1 Tax=Algoriphagus sp. NF TaxID=2992756 RepID=UPI00237BDAE9|nr:hypothetical protein [Algoriphagus sp. NF]MDE0560201.1 hypothetical protein [Algoriphagus sp. NF]